MGVQGGMLPLLTAIIKQGVDLPGRIVRTIRKVVTTGLPTRLSVVGMGNSPTLEVR